MTHEFKASETKLVTVFNIRTGIPIQGQLEAIMDYYEFLKAQIQHGYVTCELMSPLGFKQA